jgi:hypothetical protein
MTEQLLHDPNVVAHLEEMHRERVPEGMAAHTITEPTELGAPHGSAYRTLDHGLVQVMPDPLPGVRYHVSARRGKEPMPPPVAPHGRPRTPVLVRQNNIAAPRRDIAPPQLEHRLDVRRQHLGANIGHPRDPMALAVLATHEYLAPSEIHILHAQRTRLEETKTAPVHQERDEPRHPVHLRQHAIHALAREHRRQARWLARPWDTVEP